VCDENASAIIKGNRIIIHVVLTIAAMLTYLRLKKGRRSIGGIEKWRKEGESTEGGCLATSYSDNRVVVLAL
jgi:hypothetical protein